MALVVCYLFENLCTSAWPYDRQIEKILQLNKDFDTYLNLEAFLS